MVKINKFPEIAIDKIDLEDSLFSLSFPEELNNLTESINRFGLLHPIILYQNCIVCGRRRVLSCIKLGMKRVPARIIEEKFPEIEIFRLNLEDNLFIRELNVIEKSTIINKLLNFFNTPQETIIKDYLPLISIPSNIKYLKRYIWLIELPKTLKELIINTKVSLDTLNIARDWPVNIRDDILLLVLSLGLGDNKIREILSLLNDISARDNYPIGHPLKSEEWEKTKNNPQIPICQKGLWLRNYLLTKRYPNHTEFKNRARNLISRLNLPENIYIELKDLLSWEYDSIELKVRCKRIEDLEQSIKRLDGLSNSPELMELLDLIRISR